MSVDGEGFERFREQLDSASFGVLATHGPSDRLDLVPCCFAVATAIAETTADAETAVDSGEERAAELVTAIDHKPKRTNRLARLRNVERNTAVTLLVDHRDPADWSQLWWLRAQGTATIETEGHDHTHAIDALVAKYRQYQAVRPEGPVIRISVDRWTSWGI